MATSPLNEHNREDATSFEVSASSEPQKVQKEDNEASIASKQSKDVENNTENDVENNTENDAENDVQTSNHDAKISNSQDTSLETPESAILTSEDSRLSSADNQKPSDDTGQVTTDTNRVVSFIKAFAKQKKRSSRVTKVLVILLAIVLILASTTTAIGYYYYKTTLQKPLAQIYRPVARSNQEGTPKAAATSAPVYEVIKGRSWNILLLGSDNDSKYTFPGVLTQVMMVVHVDTVKNTVTMVSIPRDSWVSAPGFGMHKIDQAFFLGEQQTGKFEDGIQLARDTIEKDYGITIDRYAWVGLDGFSKVIDTLGGVDIDIEHPIVDDSYPNDVGKSSNAVNTFAYKRIYLATGPQHLNGQEALEYVRSRHSDLIGDIGRTQRQQQVLEALKLKLNATTIVENFSQLLNDLSGNIYTDLNEAEMLAFANYGRTLLNNPIQHITLGVGSGDQSYGNLATIYDPSMGANQDVVLPNCTNIQPVINSIFDLGNTQSCHTGG